MKLCRFLFLGLVLSGCSGAELDEDLQSLKQGEWAESHLIMAHQNYSKTENLEAFCQKLKASSWNLGFIYRLESERELERCDWPNGKEKKIRPLDCLAWATLTPSGGLLFRDFGYRQGQVKVLSSSQVVMSGIGPGDVPFRLELSRLEDSSLDHLSQTIETCRREF